MVVLTVLQALTSGLPFVTILALTVGTNIILAVSLNMVNGMTGQFSIGHAGFMAVGAYVSGVVSKSLAGRCDMASRIEFTSFFGTNGMPDRPSQRIVAAARTTAIC